jgi:putative DNA primase/helicase
MMRKTNDRIERRHMNKKFRSPNLRVITNPRLLRRSPYIKHGKPAVPLDIVGEALPFSEDELALRFTAKYADELRYVAKWGKWFRWTGQQWREDSTLKVFDNAREVGREAAHEAARGSNKSKLAKRIASAQTRAAIENLARSDRRHAATVEQWDADPWLLNTPGGTVELKSGKIRPHDPADHLTKITSVTPDASCSIVRWRAFLERVTNGDKDLQSYLQRIAGYALTGETSEHKLFFFYGTGANGKGVFFNTITGILGDYQRTAPIETFTESKSDRHPTELAGLRGARLVTATETEKGRGWAEAKIKTLTGGDLVSARFMNQDFFEYRPQFKLMISGNHRPKLRTVDEAIRRRLHLVPFTVTIPVQERDLDLSTKLISEWPGILAWMIEGCVQWQRIGLAPPAAVTHATETYLASEDAVATWIADCCERDINAFETTTDLFQSWKHWASHNGEDVGKRADFCEALEHHARPKRKEHGRGFEGLRLKK